MSILKKTNIICLILAMISIIGCGLYYYKCLKNKDTVPPVISMDSDTITCKITANQEDLMEGVTATDEKDGNLTNHIMIKDIKINDNDELNKHSFNIEYIVFDSSNNSSTASRTLIYKNYHSPRFNLAGELRFDSISSVNLYNMITAEDCIDGDISTQITLHMGDDYLNAVSYGVYDCEASVTNSFGDTSILPLEFEIYDSTSEDELHKPEILLDKYIVYIKKGKTFHAKKHLKSVVIDNIEYSLVDKSQLDVDNTFVLSIGYQNDNYSRFLLSDDVDIDSNVNTKKSGTYVVTYSMKNPKTGTFGSTKLYVVVE